MIIEKATAVSEECETVFLNEDKQYGVA